MVDMPYNLTKSIVAVLLFKSLAGAHTFNVIWSRVLKKNYISLTFNTSIENSMRIKLINNGQLSLAQ